MSPWHAALKRSSTLRAYFARIADSVPQNTATNFSIIERPVLRRLVFENTPALAVLASSLETIVPSRVASAFPSKSLWLWDRQIGHAKDCCGPSKPERAALRVRTKGMLKGKLMRKPPGPLAINGPRVV